MNSGDQRDGFSCPITMPNIIEAYIFGDALWTEATRDSLRIREFVALVRSHESSMEVCFLGRDCPVMYATDGQRTGIQETLSASSNEDAMEVDDEAKPGHLDPTNVVAASNGASGACAPDRPSTSTSSRMSISFLLDSPKPSHALPPDSEPLPPANEEHTFPSDDDGFGLPPPSDFVDSSPPGSPTNAVTDSARGALTASDSVLRLRKLETVKVDLKVPQEQRTGGIFSFWRDTATEERKKEMEASSSKVIRENKKRLEKEEKEWAAVRKERTRAGNQQRKAKQRTRERAARVAEKGEAGNEKPKVRMINVQFQDNS